MPVPMLIICILIVGLRSGIGEEVFSEALSPAICFSTTYLHRMKTYGLINGIM